VLNVYMYAAREWGWRARSAPARPGMQACKQAHNLPPTTYHLPTESQASRARGSA